MVVHLFGAHRHLSAGSFGVFLGWSGLSLRGIGFGGKPIRSA